MIQLEGPLFEAVQYPGLFKDSKTFVDVIPKIDEKEIEKDYLASRNKSCFQLEPFLRKHFIFPHMANSPRSRLDTSSMNKYIESMWKVLEREPVQESQYDTLIPIPYPFIIPGGRFRETYYWDNYFTAIGLATIGEIELIEDIINNFVYLQKKVGHIPNGNRKYYCSRSQPPVFILLIELLKENTSFEHIKQYIPALEKEHEFWMDGQEKISSKSNTHRRIVLMPDGSILNRYYDDADTPRPEAYAEDRTLGDQLPEAEAKKLYRNIRAACESGWDFSSRWLVDPKNMLTHQTTDIIPVDLNSLLYALEQNLGEYHRLLNNHKKAQHFLTLAEKRKNAINRFCWCDAKKFFFDFNFKTEKPTPIYSLAATVPLFVSLATSEQAKAVAKKLKTDFLHVGGLPATTCESGQQWDGPNGWPPLHWFVVKGLLNYQHQELAVNIMYRFLKTAFVSFYRHKRILEKYNVCNLSRIATDGEYQTQTGFAWTNGIILKFQQLFHSPTLEKFTSKYTPSQIFDDKTNSLTTTIVNNYFFCDSHSCEHFTNREAQTLIGILKGKTAGGIALELDISTKTVEQYTSQIKKKLHCLSRSQIFEKAICCGFLSILLDDDISLHID